MWYCFRSKFCQNSEYKCIWFGIRRLSSVVCVCGLGWVWLFGWCLIDFKHALWLDFAFACDQDVVQTTYQHRHLVHLVWSFLVNLRLVSNKIVIQLVQFAGIQSMAEQIHCHCIQQQRLKSNVNENQMENHEQNDQVKVFNRIKLQTTDVICSCYHCQQQWQIENFSQSSPNFQNVHNSLQYMLTKLCKPL